MDRRGTLVAGVATLTVAGTVGTAYVGTGWVRAIVSHLPGRPNVLPAIRTWLDRPSVHALGLPEPSGPDPARTGATPTPASVRALSPPKSASANVQPDKLSEINARALQLELAHLPLADLVSTDERNDLEWMRAEENLARDVCLAFLVKWKKGPFAAIAATEATHGEAVRQLLARYDIADPAPGPEGASATDPTFGAMYRDLITTGSRSYVDALRTAATVEELDIRDLRERRSTREDVARVYQRLVEGSQVSLRTLLIEIERQGVAWVPTYLKAPELASIMGSTEAFALR